MFQYNLDRLTFAFIVVTITSILLGAIPDSVTSTKQNKLIFHSKYDDYSASLDAGNPATLIDMIKKIHANASAPQNATRPIYAPESVVNKAYSDWTNGASEKVCSGDVTDAIFATPSGCMRAKLVPGHLPVYLGKPRLRPPPLQRRNTPSCVYTTVRCITPSMMLNKPSDITQQLEKQFNRTGFWNQLPVYGLNKVVNAAYRLYYPDAGLDPNKDVCGKVMVGQITSAEGSLLAEFWETDECRKTNGKSGGKLVDGYGAKKKPVVSFYGGGGGAGMAPRCRKVIVECL